MYKNLGELLNGMFNTWAATESYPKQSDGNWTTDLSLKTRILNRVCLLLIYPSFRHTELS